MRYAITVTAVGTAVTYEETGEAHERGEGCNYCTRLGTALYELVIFYEGTGSVEDWPSRVRRRYVVSLLLNVIQS